MKRRKKFVFGPVNSRRLGRSLGVDPVPLKACTYDCVYCQLGPTPGEEPETREYPSPGEIIPELKDALQEAETDYITLSGSGEPTLNPAIGKLIKEIKKITRVPVCVITNASLLYDEKVRERLMEADLVIPSLDAGDEETHKKINRPRAPVKFSEAADGLQKFSKGYRGRLWLEVMLVKDINDSAESLEKIRGLAEKINPEKIQINTVARPPACADARRVEPDKLELAKEIFGKKTEIIAEPAARGKSASASAEEVLQTINRRPSTAQDIAAYLGLNINEAVKHIAKLVEEESVIPETVGENVYYKPKR